MDKNLPVTSSDLEKAYLQYASGLIKYLSASGANEADAGDILHDSYIIMWRSKDKIISPDKIISYWFPMLQHTMYDLFRRQKRMTEFSEDYESEIDREEDALDTAERTFFTFQDIRSLGRIAVQAC